MIGFNIARYFKLKNAFESLTDISLQDLLLKYINREEYDYDKWVSDIVGGNVSIDSYIDSLNAFQPSWLYAYKVFNAAKANGLSKNLMIHSDKYIPFVEKYIMPTFNDPNVKYVYGDIIPILNQHPNITYLTSSPTNIKKCLAVEAPFALTIVDQFIYLSDMVVKEKVPDKLKEKGIFVSYTGIFSSGFIDNIKEDN